MMRDKLISYDVIPINPALFDEEPDFEVQDYDLNPTWLDSCAGYDVKLPIQLQFDE